MLLFTRRDPNILVVSKTLWKKVGTASTSETPAASPEGAAGAEQTSAESKLMLHNVTFVFEEKQTASGELEKGEGREIL